MNAHCDRWQRRLAPTDLCARQSAMAGECALAIRPAVAAANAAETCAPGLDDKATDRDLSDRQASHLARSLLRIPMRKHLDENTHAKHQHLDENIWTKAHAGRYRFFAAARR
jgi:hypothetical protein